MKKKSILAIAVLAVITVNSVQKTQGQAWSINGNTGTIPPSHFIGTRDIVPLVFKTRLEERMRISAGGNVGIGTTQPNVKLHVFGGTDASLGGGGYIVTGNLAADNIVIDNNEIMARNGESADGSGTLYLNSDGGDISFRKDAMRITSNKLIGIGTSSPSQKLHVVGTTLLNGHVSIGSGMPDATWGLKIGTTTHDGFLMGSFETLEDFGSNTFGSNSNIVPTTDDQRSLGSSTNRWSVVWATDGTIHTSDFRDKKNIRDLDYGLNKLMQLHPVKFNWKEGINTGDKVGLIAQEIQKVLPEVVRDYDVRTDEATGKQEKVPAARLGVNYTELIPVLIKSIQELEMQVVELQKQVNSKTQTNSAVSDITTTVFKTTPGAVLEQNAPNPFRSNTVIRYHVPTTASSAQIIVTNTGGNTIKTFTLTGKGAGSVTIKAGELAAGNYFYTLMINGKKADSKQMILIK